MTSRARRIVLAMYGYHRSSHVVSSAYGVSENFSRGLDTLFRPCGCYEAMDEPDATDVAPVVSAEQDAAMHELCFGRPRIVLGGNYGMPCA